MIGIILTVLKIIGILLLCIIGLVLLLLSIVLFNPIRYRAKGSFYENEPKIRFRATYFLGLIRFNLVFENGKLMYRAKIAFKTLVDSEVKDLDEKVKEKVVKDVKEVKDVDNYFDDESKTELETAEIKNDSIDTSDSVDSVKKVEKKKKSKLKEIFEKIKFKFLQICGRIKKIFKTYQSYRDFLTTKESREAIKEIKSRIFKALKAIKPRKIKARLKFGFEDPALTGQVLGALSILYPIYGDNLILEAEFLDVTQLILEGEFKLKGRIRVITLLIQFLKIYRNKRLKEFIRFIKVGGN